MINIYKWILSFSCHGVFINKLHLKKKVLTLEMQLIYYCLVFVLQWCPEDPIQDLVLPMPNCWMLRSGYSESPGNTNGTLVSKSVTERCLDVSLCNAPMAMGAAWKALSHLLRPSHLRMTVDQGMRAGHFLMPALGENPGVIHHEATEAVSGLHMAFLSYLRSYWLCFIIKVGWMLPSTSGLYQGSG